MREILFRGISQLGSHWCYGHLLIWPSGKHEILSPMQCQPSKIFRWPVDPETVGQYTGQTDRHVMKIFEGDILAFINDDGEVTPYEVRWSDHGWAVRMVGGEVDDDELDEFFAVHSEIVGNIHDNPELMETRS